MMLAATERAVPSTLPRSGRTATLPLASGRPYRAAPRLPGSTTTVALASPLFQAEEYKPRWTSAGRLINSRPLKMTVCKATDPSKDAAKDDDKDKDKDGDGKSPQSRAAEKRAKFLAGVKIPDESEATKKGIKKGDPNP